MVQALGFSSPFKPIVNAAATTSQPNAVEGCDRPRSIELLRGFLEHPPPAAESRYPDRRAKSGRHRCVSCSAPRRTKPPWLPASLETHDAGSSPDIAPYALQAASPCAPRMYPPHAARLPRTHRAQKETT